MSVHWNDASQQAADKDDKTVPAVTNSSAAWAQLADTFPEWTLEPPLVLAPRRPSS